uniref:Neprosin PEP catalytic domain-containing protein n=1 Tax=Setaria viridis TaxID=4556 RepID=A0A4U6V6V7_SETVI|nr:hypothetical protein SEVIR_4G030800v2 [Setaria viridis]
MAPAARVAPALGAITLLLVAAAGACALAVNKTIESDDGDVIDCVDVYQQPAFKHVLPGTEVLRPEPERSMRAMAAAASLSDHTQERQPTWRKHGSCPPGTVAIRRDSPHARPEVARRASPFRRPAGAGSSSMQPQLPELYMDNMKGKVEVAAAYACNQAYLGARATVPYWKVDVHPDELSMNYLLVGHTLDNRFRPFPGGQPPPVLNNQIAVGLVAWPALYGDSLSRLFVYYSNDGGVNNNCFNLDCAGFHLYPSSYALGSSVSNADSQVGGERYGVPVGIHRDPTGEIWVVTVSDHPIGYYPETVFDTTFPEAFYVEMGGRVLDTRPGGNHTSTPMGNGIPSCAGSRFAATIMDYHAVGYTGVLVNDKADRTVTTTPSCYGAKPLGPDPTRANGYNVAYGGPGGIYCDKPE